jgi:glycosyltransferase involved in cell wall biosynthesis
MKILVIATWYPNDENPAEAPFNADHVEAIRRCGHQVRVVHVRLGSGLAMPSRESDIWDGTPVRRVLADPAQPRTLLQALRTLHREMAWADVIHTMAFSSILVTSAAWALRAVTGRGPAWVHTEHWNGVVNPRSVSPVWAKLSWLRAVLRLPHVVTGVTGQLAGEMQKFARPHAAMTIPCVVRGPETVTAASFGPVLRLVAVGGLIARKRPKEAIEAIAWLRDQGTDANLTWVGEGPLREECEKMIVALGLKDRVRLVGSVRPADVAGYLSAADLFFLPTAQENFFTSAAEALAAGRAVVATRVGGFSDYADDANSRLVDDPAPEALGRAVLDARAAFRNVPAEDIADPIRARFSPVAVGELFDRAYVAALARA